MSLRSVETPVSGVKQPLECHPSSVVRIDESLSPASLDSVVIAEIDGKNEKFSSGSPPMNSVDCLESDQLMQHIPSATGFTPSPYVPLYVTLAVSKSTQA